MQIEWQMSTSITAGVVNFLSTIPIKSYYISFYFPIEHINMQTKHKVFIQLRITREKNFMASLY